MKKRGKGKKAAASSSEARQQESVQVVPTSARVASSIKRVPQSVPTTDSVPLRKLTANSNDFHRVGDNAGFRRLLNEVLLIREKWIIKVCKETGKRYFFVKDLGMNAAAFLTQDTGQRFIATGDVVYKFPVFDESQLRDESSLQALVDEIFKINKRYSISTKEYYHLAGSNSNRKSRELFGMRHPDLQLIERIVPSFQVTCPHRLLTNFYEYGMNVERRILANLDQYQSRIFKQVRQDEAIRTLVDKILYIDELGCKISDHGKLVIFTGEWSNPKGVKGHQAAPVKKLNEELSKYGVLLPIDEYLSSQKCCKCGSQVNMVAFKDNEMYLKSQLSKEEYKTYKCRWILHCTTCSDRSIDKKPMLYSRDFMPAWSILNLGICRLYGLPRPNELKSRRWKEIDDAEIIERIWSEVLSPK